MLIQLVCAIHSPGKHAILCAGIDLNNRVSVLQGGESIDKIDQHSVVGDWSQPRRAEKDRNSFRVLMVGQVVQQVAESDRAGAAVGIETGGPGQISPAA